MERKRGTIGERITGLEIAYGSQKRLAESLGVSTRTIRRWKHATDKTPERLRAWSETKVQRREHYRYVEKYDTVPAPRNAREIVLNDHINVEFWADVANDLPQRYPALFDTLMESRPDIVVTVMHREGRMGGSVVLAPSSDPTELAKLRAEGYTIEQRYISGEDYSDWISLSSELWHVFRDTYKLDGG